MRYLKPFAQACVSVAALCGAAVLSICGQALAASDGTPGSSSTGSFSVTGSSDGGAPVTVAVSGLSDVVLPPVTVAGSAGQVSADMPVCFARSALGNANITVTQVGATSQFALNSTIAGRPQMLLSVLLIAPGVFGGSSGPALNPGVPYSLLVGQTCRAGDALRLVASFADGTQIPPGTTTYSGQFQITVAPL